jgi:signal transduction histidine kinase
MAIERRLRSVFGVLALVLLAIFLLQGLNRQTQLQNRDWARHTREVIAELALLRARVTDGEAAVRAYVLSGKQEYAEQAEAVHADVDRHVDALGQLVADNPGQMERVKRLRGFIRERREAGQALVQLRESRGLTAAARAFADSRASQEPDVLRSLLRAMEEEEQRSLERRQGGLNSSDRMWFTSLALVNLVLVLSILAYLMFRAHEQHRAALEQKLRDASREFQESNRLKSEFLGHMSHELRTPLNAIIGYTGTLLMRLPGPLTADQEKQLKTIQSSGRHLLSLINELLDLAKIESGKTEVYLEALPCREVVEQVVSTLRPLALVKSLELDAKFPEEPVHATTDRRAFHQILLNLTNNAIKFTEKGSVRLELREREDHAVVDIIDTGLGVRQEDQEKLFEAFRQLRPGGALQEGTGLGLYLSGRLVKLIGGQIEFESEYGKGSRFTVVIPKA